MTTCSSIRCVFVQQALCPGKQALPPAEVQKVPVPKTERELLPAGDPEMPEEGRTFKQGRKQKRKYGHRLPGTVHL